MLLDMELQLQLQWVIFFFLQLLRIITTLES